MTHTQDTARLRLVGALFLAAFVAYGAGSGLVTAVTETDTPLVSITSGHTQISIGVGLMLANSLVVLGIGILLLPTLLRRNRAVAWSYLATRVLEAGLLALGAVGFLSLKAQSTMHALATAQLANFYGYQTGMAVLGFGSLFFCALLYRRRLVPRWLAGWGLLGYTFLLAGALLELSGVPYGIPLSIPGGLFEVVFGIRLITKGFDRPV